MAVKWVWAWDSGKQDHATKVPSINIPGEYETQNFISIELFYKI